MTSTVGPPRKILSVGLTGGIACGRTTVCTILARLGACVIDMDHLAHVLVAPGGKAVSKVVEAFGDGVRDARGGVDRKALGKIVFHDPARRASLEAILHPMIRAESEKIIEQFARARGRGIAVTDAALLVETGAHRNYDRLVVVVCEPHLQLRRLMARDSLPEQEASARIAAQAPLEEKVKLADHVIDTSGTLAETEARAHDVYALLIDELDRESDPTGRRRT